MQLNTSLQQIKKITLPYLKELLKIGVKTLEDIFYYFPRRYENFSNIIPIANLKADEVATIQGQIIEIKNIYTWHRKMVITQAVIKDKNNDTIKVIWYNQPYLLKSFPVNTLANLSGKVMFDKHGPYLSSPVYEKINPTHNFGKVMCGIHTGRLVPIYPETKKISSRWLRYIIHPLLNHLTNIKDFLPYEIKKSQQLLDLPYALKQIHFPDNEALLQKARQRLSFDELFLIQLSVLQQKKEWDRNPAISIKFNQELIKNFISKLPFKLTIAQKKSAWAIIQDLEKTNPMNRLLEGDVGSGKTIVALIATLQVCSNNYQVALMAPTEILAQQHYESALKFLKNFNIGCALLTKNNFKKQNNDIDKNTLLEEIAKGEINFLIGTHSLIQDRVKFKNLNLVIIDEQHRFGVNQRAALSQKLISIEDGLPNSVPHLLSMTATPIPRTLALTIYGDLDISLLDEIPKGRPKIITKIVHSKDRPKAYEFIRQQIERGRQAFVICPRIEDTPLENENQLIAQNFQLSNSNLIEEIFSKDKDAELKDIKSVKKEYENLRKNIFPKLKIEMLHGKIKADQKEKILKKFKNKKIDILVATSIIEVGIDIPNATIMLIEGSERFGLAQLHQFRGRIGRGAKQSYCFLFTEAEDKINSARLKALIDCQNGFELAEKDLELRGPGEFYSAQQWGASNLKIASLTDIKLIQTVRKEAIWLINQDSKLTKYPLLKERTRKINDTISYSE